MPSLILQIVSWPMFGIALLIFGFAPGALLRLIVLAFRRDDPRRRELLGELHAVPRIDRPFWIVEQLEVALVEGLGRRLANVGRSFVRRSSASARRVPGRVVYVNVPPRLVNKYLLPTERIVTSIRMPPLAVISPVILIVAGAVAAGFVTEVAARSGGVRVAEVIWVLWAVLAVWQGSRIATWWRRYFVVTENRLMLITSLVDTDVGMMPLAKVTDMRLHQKTFGHILGYAEFIVESAGQDQALSRIPFVPYPSQMYQEILSLIFSPKPQGGNGGT